MAKKEPSATEQSRKAWASQTCKKYGLGFTITVGGAQGGYAKDTPRLLRRKL